MADATQSDASAEDAAPTILDRIFEDGRLVRDEHQVDGARNMLHGFVEEATKAGVQIDGTAKRALAARIVALDQLISKQVNEVLHHPKFQRLEASWRNLHKLMDENDLTTSRVRVFNCHRSELERDFRRAPGFDQSVFFKHVYESEYGTLGGSPYTFLVGDMEFGRSPMDIQFLRDISSVASMAHAPFLASAGPGLLDLDSFTELDRPIDIAKIFDTSEMASWNSLRDSADSRYLALTAPRTLVRLPWGPDTAPVEGMDFVEEVDDGDHGKYLWGPSSWSPGRSDHEVLFGVRLAGGDPRYRDGRQGGQPAAAHVPVAGRRQHHEVSDRNDDYRSARKGTLRRGSHRALPCAQHRLRSHLLGLDREPAAEVRRGRRQCQCPAVGKPAVHPCLRPFRPLPQGDHARQDRRIHVP